MLTLHINQSSATHLFELPLPLDLLADELRNLGISKPLHQLTQHDFILQAMNPLGAHFMKLLQPDDSLHAIAMYAREFDVMTGESRQALADLVMTDRFYDLDHMANYLQHGSAALTHLLRLSLGGKHIDLPAPTQELCEFLGCSPRKVLLSDVDYTPLNAQGRELLTSLRPYDNLAVTNLAGTLMDVPDIKVTITTTTRPATTTRPPTTTTRPTTSTTRTTKLCHPRAARPCGHCPQRLLQHRICLPARRRCA